MARAYEEAAAQIDAAHGGTLTFNSILPITAASVRLEGRVAAHMPARWMREHAEAWEDVVGLFEG